MSKVDRSVVRDRGIPGALVYRYLGHDGQLAAGVHAGYGQQAGFCRADVQQMSAIAVVDIVNAVSGIDRREYRAVMSHIHDLGARTAADEELACFLIDAYSMRAAFPAGSL